VERWIEFLFETNSENFITTYKGRKIDSDWWYKNWGVIVE